MKYLIIITVIIFNGCINSPETNTETTETKLINPEFTNPNTQKHYLEYWQLKFNNPDGKVPFELDSNYSRIQIGLEYWDEYGVLRLDCVCELDQPIEYNKVLNQIEIDYAGITLNIKNIIIILS